MQLTTFRQRVRAQYRKLRAENTDWSAGSCLTYARTHARYTGLRAAQIGETETREYANGMRATIEIATDDCHGAPWQEYDYLGKLVYVRRPSRDDKRHGRRWIDHPREPGGFWWTLPEDVTPAGIKRMEDMIVMYLCEQWEYVDCVVTVYDADDNEIASDCLGGIDTYSPEYVAETSRGMLAQCLRDARDKMRRERRAARIANRFADAMHCGL